MRALNYNTYKRTVLGVGFIGEGDFSRSATPLVYDIWYAMLRRCYSKSAQKRSKNKSYIGCKVVKRWHNLQNFGEDIIKMPNWDTKGFSLDKDGIKFGNRLYSPKYCSFLPDHVNTIISSLNHVGVILHKGHYVARISKWGTPYNIAQFKTFKEAALVYAREKTKYIREVAKYYKDEIHRKVYRNLRAYQCPV